MRGVFLLILAACAESPSVSANISAAPASGRDAGVALADATIDGGLVSTKLGTQPSSVSPTPPSLIPAVHVSSIIALATTDDGKVVVSADRDGGVRFWPSLDGKREPVVVRMAAPSALALARVDQDLAIAGLDELGQLEIVRVRATGELITRSAVPRERWVSVAATAWGFVSLRSDRAVVVLDPDGSNPRELVAEPGQHVLSLAVRGERALAVFDEAGTVRGRWVELSTGTWGAVTPALPIDGQRVALSADHKRIVGVKKPAIVIVDVASGKIRNRFVDDEASDDGTSLRPIGFSRAGLLAFVSDGNVFWWDGKDNDLVFREGPAAVGGDHVIVESDRSLVIARANSDDDPVHLGYRMAGVTNVLQKGNGFLATDWYSVVELDASFATRKTYELPLLGGDRELTTIRVVDTTHVIGDAYVPPARGTYLVDLETGDVTAVAPESMFLDFDHTTGIVIYYADGYTRLRKWDRKKKAFGSEALIPGVTYHADHTFVLLDPASAGGASLAVVTLEFSPVRVVTEYFKVTGEPLTVVALRTRKRKLVDENLDLAENVSESLRRGPVTNADRTLSAQIHDGRITLRDAGGAERWTVPANGASSLFWTSSDELTVAGIGGFARLDLATGALLARRCGWIFGRWDDNDAFNLAGGSMCEAP